jgi:hypothetical protein
MYHAMRSCKKCAENSTKQYFDAAAEIERVICFQKIIDANVQKAVCDKASALVLLGLRELTRLIPVLVQKGLAPERLSKVRSLRFNNLGDEGCGAFMSYLAELAAYDPSALIKTMARLGSLAHIYSDTDAVSLALGLASGRGAPDWTDVPAEFEEKVLRWLADFKRIARPSRRRAA